MSSLLTRQTKLIITINILSQFSFFSISCIDASVISPFHCYFLRLVFMGDDTWTSLFPTQFDVNLPFDSFNTKVLFY